MPIFRIPLYLSYPHLAHNHSEGLIKCCWVNNVRYRQWEWCWWYWDAGDTEMLLTGIKSLRIFLWGLCNLGHSRISVTETEAKLGTSKGMALAFLINMFRHWYVELRGISDFRANNVLWKGLYTESSQMARRMVSEEYEMD